MSFMHRIRLGRGDKLAITLAGLLLATAALAGCGGSSSSSSSTSASGGNANAAQKTAVGQPPPEWAANANAWPAHNYDISNTRATTKTSINSTNVSKLNVKWRFALKGASVFGIFASTPIVLNGTVYLQDLNSNVYALDRETGKLKWRHVFNKPDEGPNGVSYGYGRIYGATASNAFALDAQNGKLIWSRKLIRNGNEGIDMAPQLYDNTVLVSTVPGNASSFYAGNGDGIVWALDAASASPSGSSTRSRTAPSCSAIRKSTVGAASGIRPQSTARGASSSRSQILGRCTGRPNSPTARADLAATSTRTRSSPSTGRPAS